jgi:hypothetical protein
LKFVTKYFAALSITQTAIYLFIIDLQPLLRMPFGKLLRKKWKMRYPSQQPASPGNEQGNLQTAGASNAKVGITVPIPSRSGW